MTWIFYLSQIVLIWLPFDRLVAKINVAEVYGQWNNESLIIQQKSTIAPQVMIPLEIILKKNVRVSMDRIYLDNLSECRGLGCSEIFAIDVGASPSPGKTRKILLNDVRNIVKNKLGHFEVKFSGSQAVTVSADAKEIGYDLFYQRLDEEMNRYNDDKLRIRIEKIRLKKMKILVRPGKLELSPTLSAYDEDHSHLCFGEKEIIFDIKIKGHDFLDSSKKEMIFARFKCEKKFPVTKNKMAKGRIFLAADLQFRWYQFKGAKLNYLNNKLHIIGREAKRNIRKDMRIRPYDIEIPKLVRRGDKVKLLIEGKGLNLATTGKAIDDGRGGDQITVVHSLTKKKLEGEVVGRLLVKVNL